MLSVLNSIRGREITDKTSPEWEEHNSFVTFAVCITELIRVFILFYAFRLVLWL